MRRTRIFATLFLALITVGCGSKSANVVTPPPTTPKVNPLAPHGNWLFTITGTPNTLVFAGQLYELVPPTVTSNPMGALRAGSTNFDGCLGSFTVAGQASGTNQINLTINEINSDHPATVSLTGTVADNQQAMSGTWTTTQTGTCLIGDTGGTWSARLLTAVTGNWTGTFTSGATVSLSITENTDQTSLYMGMISGTVTITGSPCFTAEPYTLPDWSVGGSSVHGGETLILNTAADVNGTTVALGGQVDADATTFSPTLQVAGGICNGQFFYNGAFTKQ